MKCSCGNHWFWCDYVLQCVVSSESSARELAPLDDGVYEGPYRCTECDKEYKHLSDLQKEEL